MSIKSSPLSHALLGIIFLVSGLVVNILQLFTLIIWPFSRKWYRKINVRLVYLSWSQLVFLAENWSNSNCLLRTRESDMKYFGNESAICIMNHSFEIDWLMSWILCDRCAILGSAKVFLKKILRYVPIIGWSWIFAECLFLDRSFEKDKEVILAQMANLCDYPEHIWVLIFCEGTRFTKSKHEESVKFAESRGLPVLKHVLLPRTRGFVTTVQGFKDKIAAVYDCTVAFRKSEVEPTLQNVLCGIPMESEMMVDRIPITELPTDDEEKLTEWLYDRFKLKDENLEEFHREDRFRGSLMNLPKRPHNLIIFLTWATVILVPILYLVITVIGSGSWLTRLIILSLFGLVLLGVHKMIGVTQVRKGSQYGDVSSLNTSEKKTL